MTRNKIKPVFYNIFDDIKRYPDAVVYTVMSQRGVGKTYGFLRDAYLKYHKKFIYMKRTIDDVLTICSGDEMMDINPYKPINRDCNTRIKPKLLNKKGVGYFADYTESSETPEFVGYICAMNGLKVLRGMDLSDADYMVLDEFVPTSGDISVRHAEGSQLLDCYMTFNRRREDIGLPPIKMLLFSNCDDIVCPISDTMELIDPVAEMVAEGRSESYDPDRLLFIHHVTDKEVPISEAQKKGMFSVMKGTAWADKSFSGSFSNNDFTQIVKKSIQHSRCIMKCTYKKSDIYIYENADSGKLYACDIPHQCRTKYDFNREADRIRFLHYDNMMMRQAIMNDEISFQKYTMYDLFINFVKKFGLR